MFFAKTRSGFFSMVSCLSSSNANVLAAQDITDLFNVKQRAGVYIYYQASKIGIYHICVRSKVGKLELWIRHLSFSVKGKFLSAKLHLTGHLNHQWSENNTPSFNPESKLLYVDWCNRFGLVWTSLEKESMGQKQLLRTANSIVLKQQTLCILQ